MSLRNDTKDDDKTSRKTKKVVEVKKGKSDNCSRFK